MNSSKALAKAVLILAGAICPHTLDRRQRDDVRRALHVLVDEVLSQAAAPEPPPATNDGRTEP